MERLKIFVRKSQSEENDSYISHLDMYSEFVISMFWNSIDPDEENNWMNLGGIIWRRKESIGKKWHKVKRNFG